MVSRPLTIDGARANDALKTPLKVAIVGSAHIIKCFFFTQFFWAFAIASSASESSDGELIWQTIKRKRESRRRSFFFEDFETHTPSDASHILLAAGAFQSPLRFAKRKQSFDMCFVIEKGEKETQPQFLLWFASYEREVEN